MTIALQCALMRKFRPETFDEPWAVTRETEAMRVARTSLAAMEAAAAPPVAPPHPEAQARWASQDEGIGTPCPPAITKTPLAPESIPAQSPEPMPRCRIL